MCAEKAWRNSLLAFRVVWSVGFTKKSTHAREALRCKLLEGCYTVQRRFQVATMVAKSRTGFYFVQRCAQQKWCVASCRDTLFHTAQFFSNLHASCWKKLRGVTAPYTEPRVAVSREVERNKRLTLSTGPYAVPPGSRCTAIQRRRTRAYHLLESWRWKMVSRCTGHSGEKFPPGTEVPLCWEEWRFRSLGFRGESPPASKPLHTGRWSLHRHILKYSWTVDKCQGRGLQKITQEKNGTCKSAITQKMPRWTTSQMFHNRKTAWHVIDAWIPFFFWTSIKISRTWSRVTCFDPSQAPPHSLAPVAKRHRTRSLSGSATWTRIFWGQPRWNRITGKVAESGEELICPVSVRLVRFTVVERNHSLLAEFRDGQQHPEKLKTQKALF